MKMQTDPDEEVEIPRRELWMGLEPSPFFTGGGTPFIITTHRAYQPDEDSDSPP